MAFAQNLFEGFAQAAGDTGTVNRIEKEKSDRVATQHEELAAQTQSILNDVAGLQQQRSSLDPKHPEYKTQLEANDKALHDARQALQDLYHPEQNPGALAHLGGFIRQHLSKNKPQVTPAQAKQSMADTIAGLDKAAAAPGTAAAVDVNPFEKEKKQLIAAGFSEEDADKAVRHKAGIDKTPHVSDYAQGLRRFVEADKGDPDNPTAAQEQAYREQRKGTAGGTSKFAQEAGVYENHWGKKIKDWSPEQLTYFNQKMAYDAQHSGASTTTKLEKDEFGVIRPVEVTTTRGPMKPPVEPGMNPGVARQRMAPTKPAGSSIKVGEPLPFRATTPAITKAQTDVQEATKLASVADQVAQRPDDAVNQKRLAVALERASAGRFTTQALDYIIKAGWGNTIEGWANSPTTGALPKDIVRQLVDGAHENLRGAQDALKIAHGPSNGTGGGTAVPSGKAVSLAKAKLLPQNRGKSDDEIRKDIEAHGHTVTQ